MTRSPFESHVGSGGRILAALLLPRLSLIVTNCTENACRQRTQIQKNAASGGVEPHVSPATTSPRLPVPAVMCSGATSGSHRLHQCCRENLTDPPAQQLTQAIGGHSLDQQAVRVSGLIAQ